MSRKNIIVTELSDEQTDAIREWAQDKLEAFVATYANGNLQLVHIDYRDELNTEQIDWYLEGTDDARDNLNESIWDWESDARRDAAWDMLSEELERLSRDAADMLNELGTELFPARDAQLDAHPDVDPIDVPDFDTMATEYLSDLQLGELEHYDDLLIGLEEHDTSNPIGDMARNTGHQLFRMTIACVGEELEPANLLDGADFERAAQSIVAVLEGAGIAPGEVYGNGAASIAAVNLLRECGDRLHEGFSLDVIWYGDIETAAEANAVEHGTISFTDGNLVLLDRWNGAGMDTSFTGTITLPCGRESRYTPHLDSSGPGYGWNEVAGLVKSYFNAAVLVTPTITGPTHI